MALRGNANSHACRKAWRALFGLVVVVLCFFDIAPAFGDITQQLKAILKQASLSPADVSRLEFEALAGRRTTLQEGRRPAFGDITQQLKAILKQASLSPADVSRLEFEALTGRRTTLQEGTAQQQRTTRSDLLNGLFREAASSEKNAQRRPLELEPLTV